MKKICLLFVCSAFLLMACSTTKIVRTTQKGLKGSWTLSSITTNHGNMAKINLLFNQASPECFTGSQWNFVSNNNTGSYTFQQAGCISSVSYIKWFMEEEGNHVYFFWKFIPEGMKAKDVKVGYKLKLLSESETDFSLSQEAPFEDGTITIYYHFIKN